MFEPPPTPSREEVSAVEEAPSPLTDSNGESIPGGGLLAGFRLILSLAALAAFWVEPDVGVVPSPYALAALALYTGFSLLCCLPAVRRFLVAHGSADAWLDLAFASVLVSISGGTSSIYYSLFLFVVVIASFRPGTPSRAILIGSVVAFVLVGGLTTPRGTAFEAGRTLMRFLVLVTLGLLLLQWGRLESRNRARLAFLREIANLSNPRLGIDHLIDRLLARLLRFYRAKAVRLVVRDQRSGDAWMRSVHPAAGEGGEPFASTSLQGAVASLFLGDSAAPAFLGRARGGQDVQDPDAGPASDHRALALQDARICLSAPFAYREETQARILVASDNVWTFDRSDPSFIAQVLSNVQPILQNIRLLDRLTLESVGHERLRLANDLHDGVIQPLIGIRLGLTAAKGSLGHHNLEDAHQQIQKLIEITETEIASVRSFAGGLRAAAKEGEASDPLVRALEAYCENFSSRTGIRVQLDAGLAGTLGRRATTEILNMVAEGLSNIRRHTNAHFAKIRLRSTDSVLTIHIENEIPGDAPSPFRPKTLEERATALGGHVSVSTAPTRTSVAIELPL